ncbi:MAG: hypothetical protein P1U67_07295 [Alcanivoracaceae bacterium]|nr:hypothetical protein [Alcanivoracaceae bacterium]
MKRHLSKGLQVATILAASAFTTHVIAATNSLQNVNSVRVLLDKVNTDYQMFKGENANPKYGEFLESDIDELADARADLLDSAAADGHSAEVDSIEGNINRYLELLTESFEGISAGGYEIAAIAEEMQNKKMTAQRESSALHKALAATSDVDPRAIEYQDLSFLMQQMAARYLENAAASYGVAFRDLSDEKSIDQMAQEFSQRLDKLDINAKDLAPEVKAELNDVKRKWGFIEQSMLNFMQDQVSFLVYRYSGAIVENLRGASRTLIGGDDTTMQLEGGQIPLPPGIPAAQ